MAKQKRWDIKRKLDSAHSGVSKALDYIAEVGGMYEEHHPEHYKAFQSIYLILQEGNKHLKDMRDRI